MSKLSAFLLILALAISAFAPANIGASSGVNAPANSSEPVCGDTTNVDLLRNSNKKLVSGTVAVANGETTLFVTYTTASPWTLVQTDLAVAASLADIPVTNKGNPKVDQFPYRSSHAGVTTYTYEIPLGDLGVGPGDSLVVAAHADLQKTGSTKTEGAWSDGEEFVPGKRSWGMYFMYTVQVCNEPPTAGDDAYSVDEDNMLNVAAPGVLANDTDPESDPLTAVLVSNPTNGALTLNADGSLTYTPDANFNGSDSFTYKANDGSSDSNVATVNITVNPINDAPVATDDSYSTNEDTVLNVPAPGVLSNDAHPDGNPITAILVSGPAHGTLTLNSDGSFTYTPDANFNGSDSFTYKANDGALDSNIATVNITVNSVNDAPVATDDSYNTIEDTVLNVPALGVLSNDTDVDGDSLSAILVSGPAHGTLTLNPDGSFTYTPDVDYNGSDSFTYKANDGQADSNVATVSITILPPNAAPVANDQAVSTNEDTLLPITLSGTDSDGDSLTFTIVDNPAKGSLGSLASVDCLSNPGTCTVDIDYTPDADFNGSDSFTFKANDGTQDSNTATVDISVDPVNDAPSFTSGGNVTVNEDLGAYSAAWATGMSAGPADESGQTLSFNITGNSNPSLFSVAPAIAPDGTLSFTLADNANGTASLSVTLQDDGGTANGSVDTSAPVNFDIIVNGVNDAPVNTVPGAQVVDEDIDLVFSTANTNALSVADADAGSGNIQVTVSALNGTITPALGSGATIEGSGTSSATITGTLTQVNAALDGLKYKGNANFNSTRGSETLTLLTDDQGNTGSGGSLTDTDTVDITVNAVNDAPTALAKNFNAQANMKITGLTGLLVGATDPDTGDSGYTATFTVGTVSATTPAGGTISNLNNATGSFDFDPPPGATGNVTFTYTVCDSGNPAPSVCSAPATVTVNVAGPVIWFVDPAGAAGDGRLSNPFNTLAAAAAVDASGHRIFIYAGQASNSITLNTDEWLIGQGVTGTTFDALFGITPPAGTIARPSINGTRPFVHGVTMATSDVVRGLNILPPVGTAGLTASSATSLTVGEVSVTTVNAAAVNLSSSGGTVALTSVSANGGSNGIVLNNTTGSFAVAGTGGTCTEANTSGCSGGVIQNMTGGDDSGVTPVGTGIALNNAVGVSLTRMYIHDASNYGIRGTGVNGFLLDTSVVNGVNGTNVNTPFNDGSISFDNLSGVATITNSAIAGGFQRNLRVDNTTGTLTLAINSNSIHNTGNAAGDDGVLIEVGGGTATLNVTNNTFAAHGGDHLNVSLLGSPIVSLTFTGNAWSGGHPIGLGQGLFILAASFNSPGTFTYNISNNGTAVAPLVGNNSGGAMHVNKGSGTGSFSGTISNNFIGNAAVNGSGSLNASGIDVEAHGSGGSHTTLISNNTVRQFHNDGILILAGEGSATLNATVTGNTVTNPDASVASFHGVHFNIGTLPTDALQACLDVKNNTLTNAANEANGGVDLRMRQRQLTTVRLPGYAGANNDNTAVQNFLTATNANALTTILASNTVAGGGGGFVGGAACPQP